MERWVEDVVRSVAISLRGPGIGESEGEEVRSGERYCMRIQGRGGSNDDEEWGEVNFVGGDEG